MTSTADLAARCAEALMAQDTCSRGLGMAVVEIAPGRALLAMAVDERMVNAHGTCHGGMIFTLADSAFGFASNARNHVTVAHHCSITFVNPARLGDRLQALAVERAHKGRSAVYDVTVTNQDGAVIALLQGLARTVGGAVVAQV